MNSNVNDNRIIMSRLPKLVGGGAGGGGDMIDARIAKLESDAEHIKDALKYIKDDVREIKRDARGDFRVLFSAMIGVALGLAGLMARGFGWL